MRRLWGRVNSINVMKALWCLDELGLEYERVDAGMEHGVVDTPAYRKLNPNGRVPTLEEDGFVLWESNVIVRYLSAAHGMGTLCPEDPRERAVADQWMDWQHTTLTADVTFIFWGLVRNLESNRDPDEIAKRTKRLGGLWQMVEDRLEGRDYLMGDRLTMADIPVGAVVWRWANLDIARPRLPRVEAWHARMQEREAFRQRIMLPLS